MTGPTRVLLAYASRMGSTLEISEAIAEELRAAGHAVDVRPCAAVTSVDGYDAVLVGSAVYLRRWLAAARSLLNRLGAEVGDRPVWLFQSGPCGGGADHPSAPLLPSAWLRRQASRLGARDVATFGGRLDPEHARDPVSRWVASGTMTGDYRDWDAIHAWARDVAADLAARSAAGADRDGRNRAVEPTSPGGMTAPRPEQPAP